MKTKFDKIWESAKMLGIQEDKELGWYILYLYDIYVNRANDIDSKFQDNRKLIKPSEQELEIINNADILEALVSMGYAEIIDTINGVYLYVDINAILGENDVVKSDIDKELLKAEFDSFRKQFKGTKRGLDIEWKNFTSKNKNYWEIVPLLIPALNYERNYKEHLKRNKKFCPEWKNLSTWINQKCWTQEFPDFEMADSTSKVDTSKFYLLDDAFFKNNFPEEYNTLKKQKEIYERNRD